MHQIPWLVAISLLGLAASAAPEPVIVSIGDVDLESGDWEYLPDKVSIGGKYYQGYGYPRRTARFAVARFERFEAVIGVVDGEGDEHRMSVELDGDVVWAETLQPGDPAVRVSLPIEGQHNMTLRTDSEKAVFAEPRLYPKGSTPKVNLPEPTGPPSAAAPPIGPDGFRMAATLRPSNGPLAGVDVYHNSYAVLVGIDQHSKLPREFWRPTAAADVAAVRELLIAHYGFPPENIITLTGAAATRDAVRKALSRLHGSVVQPDDRLFFYFAGPTRTVSWQGRDQKSHFLLPYDADVDGQSPPTYDRLNHTCLTDMDVHTAGLTEARHALTLVDANFGVGTPAVETDPSRLSLSDLVYLPSHQIIFAGRPEQTIPGEAGLTHSVFADAVLQTLTDHATKPGAVGTALQLYRAVSAKVTGATDSQLTPWMPDYTTGQFLFIVVPPLAPAGQATGAEPVLGPLGHYYQPVEVVDGVTWQQARERAAAMQHDGLQGHLLTITTAAEQRWVEEHLPDACAKHYWLGGYQDRTAPDFREPDKGWRWVTGEPWDYTNWNQRPYREPNNVDGDADFLCFIAQGAWNDEIDSRTQPGFVVEYSPR